MACTYKYKGKEYSEEEYSLLLSEKNRNIADEVELIKELLPHVPVSLVKGMIGTSKGVAQGMFHKNMIILSDMAVEGTSYHEAFHAVTQLYLDGEGRKRLYDSARNEGESDHVVEERLAEEFKEYMKDNRKTPSNPVVKFFYDVLQDLIDVFRDDKHRIFSRLKRNRYTYSPTSHSEAVLYSMSDTLKNLNDGYVADAVAFMKHEIVRVSGALVTHDGTGIVNKDDLMSHVRYMWKKAGREAKVNGDLDIMKNIIISLKNPVILNELFDLATTSLRQYGLNMEKQSLDNIERKEEDIDGSLGIVEQMTVSKKNTARDSTKLLIEFLTDPNVDSAHFGSYLQQGGSLGANWKLLGDALAGTVDSKDETASEKMLAKIEKLAETHGQFHHLVNILRSDKVPNHVKTRFYGDFSINSVKFKGTQLEKKGSGKDKRVSKVEYTGGDNKGAVSILKNIAISDFMNLKLENGKFNKDAISAVNEFKDIFDKVRKVSTTTDRETSDNYVSNILPNILKRLGANISSETLNEIRDSYNTDNIDTSTRNLVNGLSWGILKSRNKKNSAESMMQGGFTEDNNFFDNSAFTKLFKVQAAYDGLPGDRMILGPDGKMMFTESLNSSMVKSKERFKQGEMFNELLNTTYHRHSNVLKEIAKQYDTATDLDDPSKFTFDFETFLYHKVKDTDDVGTTNAEMQYNDDYYDRFNKAMQGSLDAKGQGRGSIFTPLTMADKSTLNQISGVAFKPFNSLNDDTLEYFYGYALAEMERIQEANVSKGKVDWYDTKGGALKSLWFPELSKGSKFDQEHDLYGNDYATNKEVVKEYIKESLEKRIQKESEFMMENGLSEVDPNIQSKYDVKNEYSLEQPGYRKMMTDYTLNSIKMNIEFTMLFTGDPAYYKDLAKRVPSVSATGSDLIAIILKNGERSIPENFHVTVSNDIEVQSGLYKEYVKYFKANGLDVESLAPYKKDKDNDGVNVADAQGYITPERFRDIAKGLGKWEDRHDEMFDALTGNSKVDAETWVNLQDLMRDMGVPPGQPLKGMHQELTMKDGKTKPVFLKYSQAVMWPSVIKNTKLEKLAAAMEKSGSDEHVFKSGVKVGAEDVRDIDFDGDVVLGEPMKLSNFYWKLQQDLPAKYDKKGKALVGSQPKKNIIANLKGRMIGERSGEEVAKDIHAIEGALSDLGSKKIEDLWNLRHNVADDSLIRKELIEKFKDDGVSNNVIEQLESGAPLDSIFQFTEKIESELHSKITKSVVKLTSPGGAFIQMSNAGFSKLEGVASLDELEVKSRNGIIYLKDQKELQGPRKDKDGNTVPGDVFLPHSVIDKIPGIKEKLAKGLTGKEVAELLGDSYKELIGYRIPNQGMSSIDVLNIAGILPPNMGDTIVTYTEVTAKTGSDFDIDKMYVMMPHTKWNPRGGKDSLGAMEVVKYSSKDSEVEKRYREKYHKGAMMFYNTDALDELKNENTELSKEIEDLKLQKNILFDQIKDLGYSTHEIVETDQFKEAKKIISDHFDKYEDEHEFKKELLDLAFLDAMEAGTIPSLDVFKTKPLTEQNSIKSLENERIRLWGEVLLADATYGDLVTPLDSEFLKDDAYYIAFIEEIANNPESVESVLGESISDIVKLSKADRIWMSSEYFKNKPMEALEFASPTYQLKIKSQNMAGKAGVGQTANHLTNHALAQLANWSIDYELGIGNMTADGKVDISGVYVNEVKPVVEETAEVVEGEETTEVKETKSLQELNKGKTITQVISAWLNAYVDNAKDPYISLINNNTKTANTVFMMLRAGVEPEFVNRFISQPLIKKYIEEQFKMDNKSYNMAFKDGPSYRVSEGEVTIKKGKYPPSAYDKVVAKGSNYSSKADLSKLSIRDLEVNILQGGSDNQLELLNKFIEMQHYANKLNDAVKSTKADTEGTFGGSAGQIAHQEIKRKVRDEGYIKNYDNIFDGFLGNMDKNSEKLSNSLRNTILSKSSFAENAVKGISMMTGNEYATNEELNRKVLKELRTYIYSKHEFLTVDKEEKERLLRKVPRQVLNLKKKYPNNSLFKALNTQMVNGSLKISSGSKSMEQVEIDAIWGAWGSLLDSENEAESSFAKDLIRYSFITSGFTSGMSSFHEYIPSRYMEKIGFNDHIKNQIELFNQGVVSDKEFINLFLLHNYSDDKVVPSYKVKNVGILTDKGSTLIVDLTKAPSSLTYTVGEYIEPKKVVTIKGKNESKAFFLKESDDFKAIYTKAPTLSTYEKGFRTNSYAERTEAVPTPKIKTTKDIGKPTVNKEDKTIVFENIDAIFELSKRNVEGKESHVLKVLVDKGAYMSEKTIETFEGSFDEVISDALDRIKETGYDKLVTSIINNC